MKKTVVAAALFALGLSGTFSAEAVPPPLFPRATFDAVACPDEERDAEQAPKGPLSHEMMALGSVHRYSKGLGVRIGIIDSGVNPAHSTLASASLEAGVDLSGTGGAGVDPYGSGTTFASILVGTSEEKPRVRGIAPGATIVPIKIIDDVPNPETSEFTTTVSTRLVEAIDWAVASEVDVVVTTLTLPAGTDALSAAVERAQAAGVLVVAPVGELSNEGGEPKSKEEAYRYPAAYESVVAVTAIDSSGFLSSTALISDTVDLAGPGQNIPAANNAAIDATCLLGRRGATSDYAAVNAAGVAALLMAAHPDESAATIRYRMEVTAVRSEPDQRGDKGWGIIDPTGSLLFVDDGTAHGPVSPNYGRAEAEEVEGRAPPVVEPDPQRVTRPIIYVGLAAGGALALGLLLAYAGLAARRKR